MAFNPFTTFQKNQKFWMAAILMVCMVTFVFCTGSRGDLWDSLGRTFRGTGPTVARVGGYNLSDYDLRVLRDQRNVVNDYMRNLLDIAVRDINAKFQKFSEPPAANTDKKKLEERQQTLTELMRRKAVLADRVRQPRYFEGGVKLDDLIEFKLWEALADKLNIRLLPEDVDFMVRMEFFSPRYDHITPDQMFQAQMHALRMRDIGSSAMYDAVTREFRVRIARLAYLEMRPGNLQGPTPGVPTEQRVPVTLAQLWKVYQEKRSEFDVALIPIHVADFAKDIGSTKKPDQAELEKLFAKYKTNKFDPDSPLPSFESPTEVQAEFIMADPTSPIYVAAARAVLLLEQAMPVGGSPLQSPLVAAARFGSMEAARQRHLQEKVLEGMSLRKFDLYGGPDLIASEFYWPLAAHLAGRDARAITSLVANMTASLGVPALPGAMGWAGFLAVPTVNDAARLEAAYAEESQRRLLPSAKVAASMATGLPVGALGTAVVEFKLQRPDFLMFGPRENRQVLPLPIIGPELEQVMINRLTEQWASHNLMKVKRTLDRSMKPEAVKRVVEDLVPQYNLTHVITKKYYNKYNIDQAPGLAALREAYDRYYREINWFEKRDLAPERQLKEGDFFKLFFDSESFTSTNRFQVRSWPPDIRPDQMQVMDIQMMHNLDAPNVNPEVLADVQKFMHQGNKQGESFRLLDKAQKPILYWRRDDKPAEFPKTFEAAKDRVAAAWDSETAREEKALPLAKKIAEQLAKAEGEFTNEVRDKASREAGHREIVLDRIAPLVPKQTQLGGHRDYYSYHLPKDMISYPRDDMVKQLLSLYDLKGPIDIKTGLSGGEPAFVKQLNDINKVLYESVKREKQPQGKFVQVLTNKPQNVYYVAVVTRVPTPDHKDFQDYVLKFASEAPMRSVDTFITRAQEMVAKDFHAALIGQLQKDLGFVDENLAETRKSFDRDEQGS
jgi:hypothetical protein